MKIVTPGRICLFGEHQDYLGLPIIALAISLHSSIIATKRNDREIIVNMPNLDDMERFSLDDLDYSKNREYFKSAIKVCIKEGLNFTNGFESTIDSNIPIRAGASSSSSIVVGWINLISRLADNPPNWESQTIGRLAYEAEVLEFNEPGGMMDQYTTALGGCIYLSPEPFFVKRLNPKLGTFVLGNSNEEKDTLGILKRCRDNRILMMERLNKRYPNLNFSNCNLEHGKSILNKKDQILLQATVGNRENLFSAYKELKKNEVNHNKFGQLLFEHHAVLRDKLNVSTNKIDNMVKASMDAGALGAKINGSGGGGCMFAYAPENFQDVANAIKKSGGDAFIINGEHGTRLD